MIARRSLLQLPLTGLAAAAPALTTGLCDDQPLLRSTPEAAGAGARRWIHTAWDLAQRGIDLYALWIGRARQHGMSPWISMRMNPLFLSLMEVLEIHRQQIERYGGSVGLGEARWGSVGLGGNT